MSAKEVKFGESARAVKLRGVNVLRRCKSYVGPQGQMLCSTSFGVLTVTKDGVSVEEIELKDKFENMGAQMVKSCFKTSDVAGDGTTATVLAQAMLREGRNRLPPV